jgi:hypothetical protein
MPSNSETILTNQAHVGDSSLQSHTGAKYKGDGYYGRSDGFHTVQYTVTGFQGKIDMQATLAVNPVEADWFTITGTNLTSTDDSGQYNTGTHLFNFTGNYVWVRAHISDWTVGTVSSVLLNH